MPKPCRHNPESPNARRSRSIARSMRATREGAIGDLKTRTNREIDNTVDEGFCEHLANAGTNAGKGVNIPASWLPQIINGKRVFDARRRN